MFSRTTMASSMSMPMARLRPMRVITFRVKPKSRMTVKAAMTEMGRVRPVMTVERQEFRNTNTMRTVRRPPRIMVRFTSWIESRMKFESSRTTWRETPGGSSFASLSTAFRMPSATATVLAPDCFTTSRARAGASSSRARFFACSTPSTTWARSLTKMVVFPARFTGMRPISAAPAAPGGHPDQGLGGPAVGRSGGEVHVLLAQRVHHLGEGDAIGLEARPVHHHLDLAGALAHQVHRPHSRHRLQPLLDRLVRDLGGGRGGEPGRVHGDGNDGQRVGVEALHHRLFDLAGEQAADGRHLAADVLGGHLGRDPHPEQHHDVGEAFLGRGLHVADALDGVDGLLDLLRHLALHRLGGGAGVDRGDGHDGEVHVGELVDVELPVGDEAQHGQGHHHHGGEHGLRDGNTGQEHGLPIHHKGPKDTKNEGAEPERR